MIPAVQDGYTNKVLFYKNPENNKYEIFVPAYMRLTFKKITSVNVRDANAKMVATLIVSINYAGLPDDLRDEVEKKSEISINNQVTYRLFDEGNHKIKANIDQNKKLMTSIIRDTYDLEMDCDVFFTPFDIQTLTMKVAMRSIQAFHLGYSTTIKFNFMDCADSVAKFSVSGQKSFGDFGLADATDKIKVLYTNTEYEPSDPSAGAGKKKQEKPAGQPKKDKPSFKHFQHATFILQLYRYPSITALTIYVPLFLLAIVNLGIYFQNNELHDRIGNLATLLVAYMAFLPTVRSSVPPSHKITMMEILVYALFMTTMLCFYRSIMISTKKKFQFEWREDYLFLISVLVLLIEIVFVLAISLVFKFIWEPSYINRDGHTPPPPFKKEKWSNRACDEHFYKYEKQLSPILAQNTGTSRIMAGVGRQ